MYSGLFWSFQETSGIELSFEDKMVGWNIYRNNTMGYQTCLALTG